MSKTRKEQIEELLADDPGDPFLRYGLGMEYASGGDDEGALRCFRELIARSPDYVAGHMQAGRALIRLGRLPEARSTLAQGIQAARRAGDTHAGDEMQGFLAELGEESS